jgi:hypothetical protein
MSKRQRVERASFIGENSPIDSEPTNQSFPPPHTRTASACNREGLCLLLGCSDGAIYVGSASDVKK